MKILKVKQLISVILFLGLAIITPNIFGQKKAISFDPIRQKIENLLVTQQIPAISIGVAENGKIIWEEGFGWADRENRIVANEHTIYNIGSTSKPVTATAVMMLVEQGKIQLDSPVNNYLSKAAALRSPFNDLPNVTVRKLMNHTSGLSRHSQMFIGNEIESSLPQIEETIARYGVLTKPTGETFEYSNLGYGVLSHLVSRVSGQSFPDFLRQRIFLPLGMNRSFYAKPKNLISSTATGYSSDQKPIPDILADTPGAADVNSSVHDLLLFGMFHLGEKLPGGAQQQQQQQPILKDSTLLEMKQDSSVRGISKYGLGWESLQIGKYKLVYHQGSNGYGTSIFVLLPEKRICISILSNITTPYTEPLVDDILKILVSDYEENLNEFRKLPRQGEAQIYKPTEAYIGYWKGHILTWNEEIPVEMWFKADGDVHIQMKGQYRNLLNGVRFDNQFLRGSFQGNIGTKDANKYPYNLHVRLKLRDNNILNGAITSISTNSLGNVLSSWIELEKQRSQ